MKKLIKNWKALKAYDQLTIVFFGLLDLGILLFPHNVDKPVYQFSKHLLVIALILIIIPILDRQKNILLFFLRRWYLVISITFIYWDVGNFIHLIYPGYFDQPILQMEQQVFGILPNIRVQQLVNPVLTEFMQLSYAIYWFTIPVGAAIFYFKKKYEIYDQMLFYVLLTFFISYVIFIIFPVSGPRFTLVDQIKVAYEGLLLTPLLRNFVAQAGLRGGAFPSSHVAVAIVILFFMWKYLPRIGKRYFLPAVIALSLATVYGQYHYITDVLAGFSLGIIIGFLGIRCSEKKFQKKKMPAPEQAPAEVLSKF